MADLHEMVRRLEVDGYVAVPFLDEDEVARLRQACDELHPRPGSGFATDFECDVPAFKLAVAVDTSWVWDRRPEVLAGHRWFMSAFLIKWPTADSELPLHADWSYVDERRWTTIAAWIPLVDTGPGLDNGPLLVVPGSHKLVHSWRGTNTPAWYEAGREGFLAASVPVDAPAGHLVLFDNRLLHWSPPNHTDEPRPVLAAAFAPVGAQLVHAVGTSEGRARVVPVTSDFFVEHTPSGLRSDPIEVPPEVPEVALVTGSFDPWELAAIHDLPDAGAFRGSSLGPVDHRWTSRSEPPIAALREVLRANIEVLRSACAPRVDRSGPLSWEVTEAALVEVARPTPLGAACLPDDEIASLTWRTLRVLQIPASSEIERPWPEGEVEVLVLGQEPDDPPLVIRGATGWTALGRRSATTLSGEPSLRVVNQAAHPVLLLVGERLGGGPVVRRAHSLAGRFGPERRQFRRAVELAEAVSS